MILQSIQNYFNIPFSCLALFSSSEAVLGIVGGVRSFISPHTTSIETIAIIIALVLIVFISVVLGSTLPLALQAVKVDPAHSSTSIQVIMDILGVIITCAVAMSILYNSKNIAASPTGVNIADIANGAPEMGE